MRFNQNGTPCLHKTNARLWAECDIKFDEDGNPVPSNVSSRAEITTVDPTLIAYLHERQSSMARITVEVEVDGVVEIAESLLIANYASPSFLEDVVRTFECRYGKPIQTRKSKQ